MRVATSAAYCASQDRAAAQAGSGEGLVEALAGQARLRQRDERLADQVLRRDLSMARQRMIAWYGEHEGRPAESLDGDASARQRQLCKAEVDRLCGREFLDARGGLDRKGDVRARVLGAVDFEHGGHQAKARAGRVARVSLPVSAARISAASSRIRSTELNVRSTASNSRTASAWE